VVQPAEAGAGPTTVTLTTCVVDPPTLSFVHSVTPYWPGERKACGTDGPVPVAPSPNDPLKWRVPDPPLPVALKNTDCPTLATFGVTETAADGAAVTTRSRGAEEPVPWSESVTIAPTA
jgi:hypothetical protein